MGEQFLKWDSHHNVVLEKMYDYYLNAVIPDTTLHCSDGEIKAHRLILLASSETLEKILKIKQSQYLTYFCNFSKSVVEYLLEFMYKGQVRVPKDLLPTVLEAAEVFKVKGIETEAEDADSQSNLNVSLTGNIAREGEKIKQNGQIVSPTRETSLVAESINLITDPGSSDKVLNPFSTKSQLASPDSDETFIEDFSDSHDESTHEKSATKKYQQGNDTTGCQTSLAEDDVHLVEVEVPIVTVSDISPVRNESQLSERLVHSGDSSRVLSIRTMQSEAGFLGYSSTDDELDPATGIKRRKGQKNNIIRKNRPKKPSKAAGDVFMKKTRRASKRKREYSKKLLTESMKQFDYFCVSCFGFSKNIIDHTNNMHRIMDDKNQKYTCEHCQKRFFCGIFLQYHKCIKQENL